MSTRGKLTWTLNQIPDVEGPRGKVRGLTAAEIGVVFQPIVDLATGDLLAHEALVRCKRPEYTPPPVLFEHAVKEAACGALGRLIRDVAFATGGDNALFVNIHPDELSARWLVRTDDPMCFHKRDVYLEITESATFTHFDVCMSVLRELCSRTGTKLVIDDFGAGHSNLERLTQLEPAVIKLDLCITHDIHENRRKQIIVKHLVSLGKDLGATIVAEGIEKLEELSCLRDLGVSYGQGYFLARPAAPPPAHIWPFERAPRRRPPPLPARAQAASGRGAATETIASPTSTRRGRPSTNPPKRSKPPSR